MIIKPKDILTEDQSKALKEFQTWIQSKDKFKSIMGYAGTGKSFLIDYFVEYGEHHGMNVAVTATTNKAVKVLFEKVESKNFSTIHSLLNIKPRRKGTKEIFEPDKRKKKDISRYDLVIVDECSMISKKLLKIIRKETKLLDIKVLFVGDPAQLEPVGEKISHSFKFSPSYLYEIVRHGDIISKASKNVRNKNKFVPHKSLLNPPVISVIEHEDLLKKFVGFKDNPNRFRMLTWTNENVHKWNKILRSIDYGHEPDSLFVKGDVIIANEPCEKEENIIMQNSEEGVVVDVLDHGHYWQLGIQKELGGFIFLNVIKEEYKDELHDTLQEHAENKDWAKYWNTKKFYHDIRHCYAMTTHTSQGSTFENVVLDISDMDKNWDISNRNQLVYVAMTRASHNVFFYE